MFALRGEMWNAIFKGHPLLRYIYSQAAFLSTPCYLHLFRRGDYGRRAAGVEMGELLAKCDELWCFGTRFLRVWPARSAESLDLRVKRFNDRLEVWMCA